jgi:polar amino acid transport system substrate-binding protein
MRPRFTVLLATAAIVATGAFVAGCGDDNNDNSTSTGAGGDLGLLQDGQLLVGSDIPFPPFEQGQAPDYTGFDIDLVNKIGENLGLEVKYQDTSFDTIFRDEAQGKFDMVASASTITPERENTVDFSDPYYEAQQSLLVPDGSDIASVEDLSGKTVGAQDGTTGEDYANDNTDAASVRGFPEGPDAINALNAGQVDAVIIDQPVAQDAIKKGQTGFSEAAVIPTGELYGFAFAPDNDALREAVNEQLKKLKDDGTLDDLYKQWFGIEAPDSVISGTNDQLK